MKKKPSKTVPREPVPGCPCKDCAVLLNVAATKEFEVMRDALTEQALKDQHGIAAGAVLAKAEPLLAKAPVVLKQESPKVAAPARKPDVHLKWDVQSPWEEEDARGEYERFLKGGYTAYRVDAKGAKAEKLDKWDPALQQVIMCPPL